MPQPILILLSWLLVLGNAWATSANSLAGEWISSGQTETRSLTLDADGKGRFLSTHARGNCAAQLDAVIDKTFVMASGIAQHCQQRNNAVAFEFYCQQTGPDQLRCKIRSAHIQSGDSKEGVEAFTRQ